MAKTRSAAKKPDPRTGGGIVIMVPTGPTLSEKAQEATRQMRRMVPGLTGFARALSGDPKVRVDLAAQGAYTDGKTIYIAPPIELGELVSHDRDLCDQRGWDFVQMCPACRTHEGVMITLYHEIAHIAAGSFAQVSDDDAVDAITKAVAERGITDPARAESLAEKMRNAPAAYRESYIGTATMISPFLPGILNALEDVRVNIFAYRKRPGTLDMFRAQASTVFNDGIRLDHDEMLRWSEAPANAQMVVGMFAKAAQYDITGWFAQQIEDDLHDAELSSLLDKVQDLASAQDVFHLCFPVLERLRELGYCITPEEAEPEPDDEDTGGDDDEQGDPDDASGGDGGESSKGSGSSKSSDASGGPAGTPEQDDEPAPEQEPASPQEPEQDDDAEPEQDDDAEPERGQQGQQDDDDAEPEQGQQDDDDAEPEQQDADDGQQDDDAEPDEAGEDGNEPVDDHEIVEAALRQFGDHKMAEDMTDDEQQEQQEAEDEIAIAVMQGAHFDGPSQKIGGVRLHKHGKPIIEHGTDMSEGWASGHRSYYGHLRPDNKTPESIIGRSLLQMRVAFSDNAKARTQGNKRSGKVNARVLGRRIATGDDRLFKKTVLPGKRDYFVCIGLDISGSTASGALTMIKAASMAQADLCRRTGVKFAIYAHTGNYSYDQRGYLMLDIYEIKAEHEPWDDKTRERLLSLNPSACNLDGHTLEFYRKRCDDSSATDKVIMYYTDGAMPAENYHEELQILQREIATCKQREYTLMAVGVGNEDPVKYGLDTVRLDAMDDLPATVKHLAKRLGQKR